MEVTQPLMCAAYSPVSFTVLMKLYGWILSSEACTVLALQVYDATSFLKEHPGGGDSILLVAGTDATEEFDAIHSEKAKKQLLSFAIGRLATTPVGECTLQCTVTLYSKIAGYCDTVVCWLQRRDLKLGSSIYLAFPAR